MCEYDVIKDHYSKKIFVEKMQEDFMKFWEKLFFATFLFENNLMKQFRRAIAFHPT